jgi:glutaredoxin
MSNEGMKGEVGVSILTLSDCDYCMWLKSELNAQQISYTNIDARQNEKFADAIESNYRTEHYPIVMIDIGDKVIGIVPETDLDTSEHLRTFDTIPELVGIIKSYIK